jgi:hypothetical protein
MLHTPPPPLNGGRGGGVVLDLPRRRPRTTGRTRNCTARATGDPDRARLHRGVVVAANAGLLVERIQRLALRAVQAFQQPAPDWHYHHDCELDSSVELVAAANRTAAWIKLWLRHQPFTTATWTAAWDYLWLRIGQQHGCDLDSSPSQLRLGQQRGMFGMRACVHSRTPDQPQIGASHQLTTSAYKRRS